MKFIFDTYDLKARAFPGLLVPLPLVLTVFALFPTSEAPVKAAWAAFTAVGGLLAIIQIARSFGQKAQVKLLKEWKVMPSVSMLRHRDGAMGRVIKARYHKRLGELIPDIFMPTEKQESDAPYSADEVYEACCGFLKAKTRDAKKFPLVLEENINYGSRRNMYGLRRVGQGASLIALLACAAKVVILVHARSGYALPATAFAVSALMLWYWTLFITSDGVQQAANDYAVRLLESIEQL